MKTFYNIEIDYTTGSSLENERITNELVGVTVYDLDKAKENLRRIKAHYKEAHDNPNTNKKYNLTLLTDDGEINIIPFWIGYFETLHGAKIVVEEAPDMSFTL